MAHLRVRTASALLALSLLATLVTGCGGGGTEPPTTPTPVPTASIALGATAGTVTAGSSTTIPVSVTRGGGYTGDVTVSATGAPSGVTIASQTIAAGSTSGTMTVTTTSAAVAGVSTLSIAATGTGVTIASQSFALKITAPAAAITQIGADITNGDLNFGAALALSADGSRIVVAANGSANGTTRVYQRSGSTWTQLGADIIGEAAGDLAGTGVDINAAGTRIAVGAYTNDGNGTSSGHVRVFDLVGSTWTQVGADIDGSGVASGLGWSVALSASGNRLIAGAPVQNGINGSARVFDLVGTTWTQVGGTLTGTNEFGDAVDISGDGSTIAVSSPFVPSSGGPGAVQVYRLSGSTWAQVGNVLSGVAATGFQETFGDAIALTANGDRIAVGAPQYRLGTPSTFIGQVRVFDLIGSTWTQVGASVTGTDVSGVGDEFGSSVMISADGTRLAASARPTSRGRAYTLTGGAWVQTGSDFTRAGTSGSNSEAIALSSDGKTAAIGFINGNPKRVSVFGLTP